MDSVIVVWREAMVSVPVAGAHAGHGGIAPPSGSMNPLSSALDGVPLTDAATLTPGAAAAHVPLEPEYWNWTVRPAACAGVAAPKTVPAATSKPMVRTRDL